MTVHEHSNRPYGWTGALSERRGALTPDRVGLVDADTGREYTYADLDRRASRTTRLLRKFSVGRGDRVAVVSRNRPELVDLYFATARAGAVLAPLSHRLAPRELGALLDDIDPAMLVVEAPFVEDAGAALASDDYTCGVPPLVSLPTSEEAVSSRHDDVSSGNYDTSSSDENGSSDDHDVSSGDENGTSDGHTALENLDDGFEWLRYDVALPEDTSPVDRVDCALSDPHLLLHTGGSTGLPEQVVQTHGSILWNAFNTIVSWGLRDDDVTPMVFPLFHTGGWNVLTIPLFQLGATVVIAREFDPGQVLGLLEEREATVLVAVPAVLRFMVEHDAWDGTDFSSLRFVKSGGGPCRNAIIEAWNERGISISQGYGLTECGPNNFAMPEGFAREKTDSIGMPCLYVDARVVGDDGEPLPTGEVGELELASPHAGAGYWRNEAETAATFGRPADYEERQGERGETDERAWVSTGDLARVDDEGYYYIEGRKKTMYVSGGENVYPAEIEAVITDHPKVDEAIVVPVANEEWGEVGKAVVEGDDSLTLGELRAFATDRLASFKVPKHLAFVDEMPTSGPSKIDRQAVEETFGEE